MNIIFDLGQVLIAWRAYDALSHRYPDEPAMWADLNARGFQEWNLEQDRGRSWADALTTLADQPDTQAIFADYVAGLEAAHAVSIPGTVALLQALKSRGHHAYALSNMSHDSVAVLRRRHGFMALFDGTVISAEEGVIKPDAAIYQRLMTRYDLPAADCLFIDDKAENVAAAQALGMAGHVFRSPEALRDDLVTRGLLAAGTAC